MAKNRGGGGKRQRGHSRRSNAEAEEITLLEERIAQGAPPSGGAAVAEPAEDGATYSGRRRFEELPLSAALLHGLREGNYTELTTIQRAALPHALCGRDVLGAAKTGSGKTLVFVIPVCKIQVQNPVFLLRIECM